MKLQKNKQTTHKNTHIKPPPGSPLDGAGGAAAPAVHIGAVTFQRAAAALHVGLVGWDFFLPFFLPLFLSFLPPPPPFPFHFGTFSCCSTKSGFGCLKERMWNESLIEGMGGGGGKEEEEKKKDFKQYLNILKYVNSLNVLLLVFSHP